MKWIYAKHYVLPSLCFLAIASAAVPSILAQGASSAQLLVTSPVVETTMVTLTGNVRREANAANDRGAVSSNLKLEHMLLQLKRPADREAAFTQKIDALYQSGSPEFHHWLTAEQGGESYGPNPKDIAAVTT